LHHTDLNSCYRRLFVRTLNVPSGLRFSRGMSNLPPRVRPSRWNPCAIGWFSIFGGKMVADGENSYEFLEQTRCHGRSPLR
jgi:hypothetical protein